MVAKLLSRDPAMLIGPSMARVAAQRSHFQPRPIAAHNDMKGYGNAGLAGGVPAAIHRDLGNGMGCLLRADVSAPEEPRREAGNQAGRTVSAVPEEGHRGLGWWPKLNVFKRLDLLEDQFAAMEADLRRIAEGFE